LFADTRALGGIPYLVNVLTCLPIVMAGGMGLGHVIAEASSPTGYCRSGRERLTLMAFFTAVVIAGFGWSYCHVSPEERALWEWTTAALAGGLLALLVKESSAYDHRTSLRVGLGFIAAGIVAALLDDTIFALGHFISGHSVMHLLVGVAAALTARSVQRRTVLKP
jgi:ABC-type uncharacterized transport system permease subunit